MNQALRVLPLDALSEQQPGPLSERASVLTENFCHFLMPKTGRIVERGTSPMVANIDRAAFCQQYLCHISMPATGCCVQRGFTLMIFGVNLASLLQ